MGHFFITPLITFLFACSFFEGDRIEVMVVRKASDPHEVVSGENWLPATLTKIRDAKGAGKQAKAATYDARLDGDLHLDAKEFRDMMRKLKVELSSKELKQLIESMDSNKDGLVDVGELDRLMRSIQREDAQEEARAKSGREDNGFRAPKRDFSSC